jgi:preprotein translocase subunit SecG
MYTFLILVHVVICIVLTIVILLQSSKGGGLAGVFGGGGGSGMGAIFGGRGAASFLSKLTTVLAILFMGLSLLLGLITGWGGSNAGIVSQERERSSVGTLNTVPTEGAVEQPPTQAPVQDENPENK